MKEIIIVAFLVGWIFTDLVFVERHKPIPPSLTPHHAACDGHYLREDGSVILNENDKAIGC
jgi:hypothetical protein